MKKLSDYVGEEAIDLWLDLLDPLSVIATDKEIKDITRSGKPKILIAKMILKAHRKEAIEIMQRIDPAPINGLNIIARLVAIISEIGENEEIKSFFGYAEQAKTENGSSISLMENTEAEEN